mmetsp:Transcript_17770/g.55123  ORF Transcript_17770/g.55123 Transcript_17770/m.55123 type:complete len:430 (+) Transcript_17770:1578-2867(+)
MPRPLAASHPDAGPTILAQVQLRARRVGRVLRVADDGGGLDLPRRVEHGEKRGLLDEANGVALAFFQQDALRVQAGARRPLGLRRRLAVPAADLDDLALLDRRAEPLAVQEEARGVLAPAVLDAHRVQLAARRVGLVAVVAAAELDARLAAEALEGAVVVHERVRRDLRVVPHMQEAVVEVAAVVVGVLVAVAVRVVSAEARDVAELGEAAQHLERAPQAHVLRKRPCRDRVRLAHAEQLVVRPEALAALAARRAVRARDAGFARGANGVEQRVEAVVAIQVLREDARTVDNDGRRSVDLGGHDVVLRHRAAELRQLCLRRGRVGAVALAVGASGRGRRRRLGLRRRGRRRLGGRVAAVHGTREHVHDVVVAGIGGGRVRRLALGGLGGGRDHGRIRRRRRRLGCSLPAQLLQELADRVARATAATAGG